MPEKTFAFPPPPTAWVPIAGQEAVFPVRRIYCVGKNYLAHVREMGGDERELPIFFQKPADAVVHDGASIPYPSATRDLHHEVELVLAIGRGGRDIAAADAAAHVFGLAVGVDLTRRDLQTRAKNAGGPWESGKAFDHSAPISAVHRLGPGGVPAAGRISLGVNGATKQDSNLSEMIWAPAEIISHLSREFSLAPGDLIYTGTPAGVGPLVAGDRVEAAVEGVAILTLSIAA